MKRIVTQVDIAASASRVWHVLTDFAAYPQWNPFITEIAGSAEVGQRLRVRIHPPGRSTMTFRPTVLTAEPGRQLRWRGQLFIPGLFDGEHLFLIERVDEGRVRLNHSETFSGILVPLIWNSIEGPTTQGFRLMNEALRERCASS